MGRMPNFRKLQQIVQKYRNHFDGALVVDESEQLQVFKRFFFLINAVLLDWLRLLHFKWCGLHC